MITVFAEYRVKDSERDSYLEWITPIREQAGFELYEGTDQKSLFVEIWTVADEEAYRQLKSDRAEADGSAWRRLDDFVEGGIAKAHVWAFRKV
ncbi:hypothetical protein [Paenibacillus sp. MBLB4367]|uniref:hypothetical protein n=1 Tax=Paenibacillus sp. MBLB4367 TaxID=3384767 RepID=UPI0039082D38